MFGGGLLLSFGRGIRGTCGLSLITIGWLCFGVLLGGFEFCDGDCLDWVFWFWDLTVTAFWWFAFAL